ncbi:hypothetical protein Sru01_04290 [Sphaerisporangium rufum]|uniref:LytR family transcriptional regulator n=1 Tax=Sphaerisporangium rufum TaxID=1381558 RepID=A0A919UYS6_9ACTN|nr:LCP family protein [Sphaerisporangium rufum]GII75447.1 hypothetical protein Sru01_04290 [Sphaerisporangium rufum]
MSDDDSADSADPGVHVGGDAYGGVRLAARRSRRVRSGMRGIILTGALSAAVLAGSGALWFLSAYAANTVKPIEAGTAGSDARGAMNILLVGVDRRDDLTRQQQNRLRLGREVGRRTDTMMVIHVSEDHSKITVISLPRDSWVDIPGNGQHKLNAAYSLGGAKLAVRTIKSLTGLEINHYVEVNVLGFINVVDAIGGVSVCTPVAINDLHTGFRLQPGTYRLDGVKALFYARTRATARADLDRIDRQQQVISSLLQRALSSGTLANPARLLPLVDSTLKTLTVDKALAANLLELAEQLKDVSTDDVAFTTVPLANVDYKAPTGESAVLWDKVAARDLFGRVNRDEALVKPVKPAKPGGATPSASATPSAPALTIPPARIAVRVLNGTTIKGLGARAKADLVKQGFQVPGIPTNAGTPDAVDTLVRYPAGREDSARTVAAAIPGAKLREADVTGIEVVAGTKYSGTKKVTVTEPPAGTPTPSATATPAARTATDNICKK